MMNELRQKLAEERWKEIKATAGEKMIDLIANAIETLRAAGYNTEDIAETFSTDADTISAIENCDWETIAESD